MEQLILSIHGMDHATRQKLHGNVRSVGDDLVVEHSDPMKAKVGFLIAFTNC